MSGTPKLSAEQQLAARAAGMTDAEYAAWAQRDPDARERALARLEEAERDE